MYSGGGRLLSRVVAEQRVEPRQPARRHGRRAAFALGAGQQHALGGERRGEVVRRQADAPLGLRQAERCAHRPVDPRTGLDRRRPAAFVQAAQHQEVGALQSRFERPPDGEARMAAEARPDWSRSPAWSSSRAGHSPPAIGGTVAPRRAQPRQSVGQRLAGLARPQRVGRRARVRRRRRWRRAASAGAAPSSWRRRARTSLRPAARPGRRRRRRSPGAELALVDSARSAARPDAGFRPRRHLRSSRRAASSRAARDRPSVQADA